MNFENIFNKETTKKNRTLTAITLIVGSILVFYGLYRGLSEIDPKYFVIIATLIGLIITVFGLFGKLYQDIKSGQKTETILANTEKSIIQAAETLDKARENYEIITDINSNITGGNSYPSISMTQNLEGVPPDFGRSFGFRLYISIKGKYILKNIKIRITDIGDFRGKGETYHTDLMLLDLDFPSSIIKTSIITPNLVYNEDCNILAPGAIITLPAIEHNIQCFTLDKELEYQGFNIYIQSEYKKWHGMLRFVTTNNKTEFAYILQEIITAKQWELKEKNSSSYYNFRGDTGSMYW